MTVRILEDALVNQIAAGEVVERPASVVKELVENALDAGARTVEVALKAGGRALVRVVDDGSGMNRADAMMCIERHATSKIRTQEDLLAVRSLGFRGEALPSIASISRFELKTRASDDDAGTRIQVEGGTLRGVSAVGCAVGTEIDVRSLFFNVPVRRRFMRTVQTELSHCVEAVTRQALVRPDVAFTVRHEGRELLAAPRAADRHDRAKALLGDHGRALVRVGFEADGFGVRGLVSPVGVHRGSGGVYLYVNGRFVRDPVVRRGVTEAYRGIVPKGRFPVVVLEVLVPPERVDVNVHPTKTEVRFRDPRDLVRVIAEGVRAGLRAHGIQRPVDRERQERYRTTPFEPAMLPLAHPALQPPIPAHPDDVPFLAADRPEPASAPPPPVVAGAPPVEGDPRALLPVPTFRQLDVIGQLGDSYILCQAAGELVVVDQHAAHERINLHRLHQDRRTGHTEAQTLLTPIVVELPVARAELLREHVETLAEVGLSLAAFGPAGFAITAVPTLLDGADLPQLVHDVVDDLAAARRRHTGHEVVDHVLATMACHSSVRAADALSAYEMRALLAALDEVDFQVCAHGRPVAVRIPRSELERRFHRT